MGEAEEGKDSSEYNWQLSLCEIQMRETYGKNLVSQTKNQYMANSRSGARIKYVRELMEEEARRKVQTCVVELGKNNLLKDDKRANIK